MSTTNDSGWRRFKKPLIGIILFSAFIGVFVLALHRWENLPVEFQDNSDDPCVGVIRYDLPGLPVQDCGYSGKKRVIQVDPGFTIGDVRARREKRMIGQND